ncbi:hypothetical protein DMA11_13775 [Marinilabiliaceae bacterium JC017]|nr:hypothetical protein DMA11_13775 [Marinilabiliaceae bacterium JC017]
MTTRNIFASIDVRGFINRYKNDITSYYNGIDVTSKYMNAELEEMLIRIKNGEQSIMKIGYWDRGILPEYTRLISSKESTIGYKVTSNDFDWINEPEELRLNNIYNLMIAADNGDKIRWWGHSIRPNSHIQAIISDVHKINPQPGRPAEFADFERRNVQFYYANSAVNPEVLHEGVEVSTQQAYCMECTLQGNSQKEINYDIDLMLLSTSFLYEGSLISVPIVRIVVDPTIIIN